MDAETAFGVQDIYAGLTPAEGRGQKQDWPERGVGLQCGSAKPWPAAHGALECLWPIKVVQSWTEVTGLYTSVFLSCWCGLPLKGHVLGWKAGWLSTAVRLAHLHVRHTCFSFSRRQRSKRQFREMNSFSLL